MRSASRGPGVRLGGGCQIPLHHQYVHSPGSPSPSHPSCTPHSEIEQRRALAPTFGPERASADDIVQAVVVDRSKQPIASVDERPDDSRRRTEPSWTLTRCGCASTTAFRCSRSPPWYAVIRRRIPRWPLLAQSSPWGCPRSPSSRCRCFRPSTGSAPSSSARRQTSFAAPPGPPAAAARRARATAVGDFDVASGVGSLLQDGRRPQFGPGLARSLLQDGHIQFREKSTEEDRTRALRRSRT